MDQRSGQAGRRYEVQIDCPDNCSPGDYTQANRLEEEHENTHVTHFNINVSLSKAMGYNIFIEL